MADPVGRVCIAFDDGPLVADPTWTRIDDVDNLVAGIEISTGRQTEFDQTNTGSAVIRINDTDGLFDPVNVASPYFGLLDGKQIAISLWDPVQEEWFIRFRGIIDDWGYNLNPATVGGISIASNVEIQCVDIFDYLGGFELLPGVHGSAPPASSEGCVFYEDGEVNTRITEILTDAGIDPDMYVVFSGNVDVIETLYDPGDTAIVALRDAADAESAGLMANIYVDRRGRFVFHGRFARLDPEGVIVDGPVSTDTWDFKTWNVGDGYAISNDPMTEWAQLRPPFTFRRPRSRIINAALYYPRQNLGAPLLETDIPDLVYQDGTSIAAYGVHSNSQSDLIIKEHKTNGNTAKDECLLFAEYAVENNKNPLSRIEQLTVKALPPNDPRAAGTWRMLSRCDISDRVYVQAAYPSGSEGGLTGFIEGWTQSIRPLNPTHDMVELTLNVSPPPTYDPF